jgi:transposase
MDSIQRYELIRPILRQEKSIKQIHQETSISIRTLYRYLKRFRDSNGQIESLADKSHAAHTHPRWFTQQDKEQVIEYFRQHPHQSATQIAKDLTGTGGLQISNGSVSQILNASPLTPPFFPTNHKN